MEIHLLERHEIHEALAMSAEIFDGLEKEEEISRQVEEGNLIFAGCFGDGQINGLLGWGMADSGGEILFVFVKEEHRRHGMGAAIVEMLCQACSQKYLVLRITTAAPLELVPFFNRCGLVIYGPERLEHGRKTLPMERMISPAQVKPRKNTFHMGLIIGGVCVAALLLCVLIFFLGRGVVQEIADHKGAEEERQITEEEKPEEEPSYQIPTDPAPPGEEQEKEEGQPEGEDGIEGIEAYISEAAGYELTEEVYTEGEDTETSTIDYQIRYPQVSGLPSGKDEEVNQILRDAAMANADSYYINPTPEIQEFLDQQEYLYLGSEVEYKVTYMDENLLCVVFDDHYFTGSVYGEYSALRVRIIDLNLASRYEIQDVLQTDGTFLETWREKMLEEDPDNYPAAELPDEVLQETLTGAIAENRYFSNLLLTKNGVEVGFTYAFSSEDGQRLSRGWVTAPFTSEEIAPYQTDSQMWNLFHVQEN